METKKESEKRPPYVFVVVTMKKAYGLLFISKPTDDDILETFANLIQDKRIDDCFEIQRYDITEEIRGTFED